MLLNTDVSSMYRMYKTIFIELDVKIANCEKYGVKEKAVFCKTDSNYILFNFFNILSSTPWAGIIKSV